MLFGATGIQTVKKTLSRNFLPADAWASSFPGPSCWSIPALLLSHPGLEALPEPALPAQDTPASVCGAPAHTARPDSPPSDPWFDCAPRLLETRAHAASPLKEKSAIRCRKKNQTVSDFFFLSSVGTVLGEQTQTTEGQIPSHSSWLGGYLGAAAWFLRSSLSCTFFFWLAAVKRIPRAPPSAKRPRREIGGVIPLLPLHPLL